MSKEQKILSVTIDPVPGLAEHEELAQLFEEGWELEQLTPPVASPSDGLVTFLVVLARNTRKGVQGFSLQPEP